MVAILEFVKLRVEIDAEIEGIWRNFFLRVVIATQIGRTCELCKQRTLR